MEGEKEGKGESAREREMIEEEGRKDPPGGMVGQGL